MPREQGYWINSLNAWNVSARYQEVRRWVGLHKLNVHGVGLDLEVDRRELEAVSAGNWSKVKEFIQRDDNLTLVRSAQAAMQAVVSQIRSDGYRVESYIAPFILEERHVKSTLQRLTGLVDVPRGSGIPMLYNSEWPLGHSLLTSYLTDGIVQHAGLGSSGGPGNSIGRGPADDLREDALLAAQAAQSLHL